MGFITTHEKSTSHRGKVMEKGLVVLQRGEVCMSQSVGQYEICMLGFFPDTMAALLSLISKWLVRLLLLQVDCQIVAMFL